MALCESRTSNAESKQREICFKESFREIKTGTKTHAAYLYENSEGWKLQQKLCLLLSGTKCSSLYSGWEDFGSTLGLNPIIINSIKYSFHQQDPTSYILLAYVQKEDSTIEAIVEALYKIKRFDVLEEIKDQLHNFYDIIRTKHNSISFKDILKPSTVPDCPFILRNLSNETTKCVEKKLAEKWQRSAPISNSPRNYYNKKILLTYSSDADKNVAEILQKLRKPKDNFRLGVLVLSEQSHKINSSPEQFIYDCFAQVDYVCPIITQNYIKVVTQRAENSASGALENYDHKYVKYIYRLMNTYYVRRGCENNMVRCLIPDDMVHDALRHPIMDHSLFQLWVRTSEITTLIEAIITNRI